MRTQERQGWSEVLVKLELCLENKTASSYGDIREKWLRLIERRCLMFTLKLSALLPCKFPPLLLPVKSTPHKLPFTRADVANTEERPEFSVWAEMVQNSHALHSTCRMLTTHRPRMWSCEPGVETLGARMCGLDLY